jgi:hypothetical protein
MIGEDSKAVSKAISELKKQGKVISGTFPIGRSWGCERALRVQLAEHPQLYLWGISSPKFSANHPLYKNNR